MTDAESFKETITQGDAFRVDPRVQQAKRLICEALAEHGSSINGVRSASPELVESYQQLLARLEKARGGKPIWPYLASGLGNGPWVELADGSIKMDFIGGIGVHGAGHSDPRMIEAAIDGALESTVMQGNLQQNPLGMMLSERFIQLASTDMAPLSNCMLSTSGAMANENALKMAFHRATPANRVLAFENAFAGRSLAMAAITDRPNYRQGLPLAITVDYLPFLDPKDPQSSQARAVDTLSRLLDRHPGRYGAFWVEAILGEGGYSPGSYEFLSALCKPLRDAGVPIIFDEIQSFGRLSRPFAFQHFGLDEFVDIVTIGKITQVCATLYRDAFKPTAPILSQTFTGASTSISAGIATLDAIEQAGCFGDDGANVRRHRYFADRLEELAKKFPNVLQGPYGEGMMIAFTPGDGSMDAAKRLLEIMYSDGLLGFICGSHPARIRFLPPPAITTEDHIDVALKILEQAFEKFSNVGQGMP